MSGSSFFLRKYVCKYRCILLDLMNFFLKKIDLEKINKIIFLDFFGFFFKFYFVHVCLSDYRFFSSSKHFISEQMSNFRHLSMFL